MKSHSRETEIRKPSLEEWFLQHQMRYLGKHHFYVDLSITVDFTRIREAFREKHNRPAPLMPMIVRALGVLIRRRPHVNRLVFQTLLGTRMVEPAYVAVNLPILMRVGNRRLVSAISIRDPDKKSLREIRTEITQAKRRDPKLLPISRILLANQNTWFSRAQLRLIHFLAYRFPRLYLSKGGGGISMSSFQYAGDQEFRLIGHPHGPTAFSLGVSPVVTEGGTARATFGVGWDHLSMPGHDAIEALAELSKILHGSDPETLELLIGNP